MDLIKKIEDLICFRSVTGNIEEIKKCFEYIRSSLDGIGANITIEEFENASPVIYIRNNNEDVQDVLILGHLDVVAAKEEQFLPKIIDGKLYGRGSLDMKSFAIVGLESMRYVIEKGLDVKFGIILSSDEEKGSHSTDAFLERYKNIGAKVVLDNDVGGDIGVIINKCKNPVFVKLKAKGKSCHGSVPWEGLDANEMLIETIRNLRKKYPYFDLNTGKPSNTWVDTMHVATLEGGEVANIVSSYSEALLDFRLVETSSVEDLEENLRNALMEGVEYKIVSSSTPVVMSENEPKILAYKEIAEEILGRKIEFEQIGGATDARLFAQRGAVVIMHSGTGEGMHGDDEYVEIESIYKLSDIQKRYLEYVSKK
ncbi:MAG: M20 family metallopeptidase [Alphaproteobacteria bacterium]|nr:M20 family metallopeptidase [Alphaproteobacteria bacterium]